MVKLKRIEFGKFSERLAESGMDHETMMAALAGYVKGNEFKALALGTMEETVMVAIEGMLNLGVVRGIQMCGGSPDEFEQQVANPSDIEWTILNKARMQVHGVMAITSEKMRTTKDHMICTYDDGSENRIPKFGKAEIWVPDLDGGLEMNYGTI